MRRKTLFEEFSKENEIEKQRANRDNRSKAKRKSESKQKRRLRKSKKQTKHQKKSKKSKKSKKNSIIWYWDRKSHEIKDRNSFFSFDKKTKKHRHRFKHRNTETINNDYYSISKIIFFDKWYRWNHRRIKQTKMTNFNTNQRNFHEIVEALRNLIF